MVMTFSDLESAAGLKKLDDYLSKCSYITGDLVSKDDIVVHAALARPPSVNFVNVLKWYNRVEALLRISTAVTVKGSSHVETVTDEKAVVTASNEHGNEVYLFSGGTEEEKKAFDECTGTVNASSKKMELCLLEIVLGSYMVDKYLMTCSAGKSSILLGVKPWDDETDMKKLEEAVRSILMEGLIWGESKLVAAGYGIEKLQIMLTIVDDLVSVSTLIEDYLTAKPINEYVQRCEILSFNKILASHPHRKRRHRKKKSASHLLTILENCVDTDLCRVATYNNEENMVDEVALSTREKWAGKLRQRTIGGADEVAIMKPSESEVNNSVSEVNNSMSEVNNAVNRLETAESLDWKHLVAEDFVVRKSPLRYFMDEMGRGNSLRSTTTRRNVREYTILSFSCHGDVKCL
ncbi:hypothetical protein MLD38_002657 [Melastoma candidum]|uniref:Uncharacterized protein n=1 Tax=Melastoma candidum TaxID=119954 RepID=A0ACB9RZC0_9MYRT|nr:hypothetical protein MLD38_002657 [Melastoma candidum]